MFVMDRVRRIDLPARIGGDEFVVICPETAKPAARLVAERIRSGIESLQDSKGKPLDITASIGVASFPDDGSLPEEVLQRADRALYEAKSEERTASAAGETSRPMETTRASWDRSTIQSTPRSSKSPTGAKRSISP